MSIRKKQEAATLWEWVRPPPKFQFQYTRRICTWNVLSGQLQYQLCTTYNMEVYVLVPSGVLVPGCGCRAVVSAYFLPGTAVLETMDLA